MSNWPKKTLAEHLDPNNGPKRILSLDGGGIRGALTLGYLKKIESILREKEQDPNLLLCDYFDLIGGTSTGSIIAAGLAKGMSVDEIIAFYMNVGGKIFGRKRHWWNPLEIRKFLTAKYDFTELEETLRIAYGEITMGSHELKTGLCIVAKRADTNSTWPIINHPGGKYFQTEHGGNKDIPVWQAVRASSAAPTYFKPQLLEVSKGKIAAFIDGGVSTANNPVFTLLGVATLQGFPFRWQMNPENLHIVSVGTGYSVFKKPTEEIEHAWLKTWAENIPNMLMQDSNAQNQMLLQWMSVSPTAGLIDSEIGDLNGDHLGEKPLVRYLRYNMRISTEDLNALKLDKIFTDDDVLSLTDISKAENRFVLFDIGTAASDTVKKEHFYEYL